MLPAAYAVAQASALVWLRLSSQCAVHIEQNSPGKRLLPPTRWFLFEDAQGWLLLPVPAHAGAGQDRPPVLL